MFCENDKFITPIRELIISEDYEKVKSFSAWKKQKWQIDPEWFREKKDYCLPTVYDLPPLILTKKKLILQIGEVDTTKLP